MWSAGLLADEMLAWTHAVLVLLYEMTSTLAWLCAVQALLCRMTRLLNPLLIPLAAKLPFELGYSQTS